MSMPPFLKRSPWRTVIPGTGLLLALSCGYLLWAPGLDVRDGRHDRGRNALWLSHGWLGADEWFIRNGKTNEYAKYRDPKSLRHLADKLRRNHISDVFPHLCPAEPDGRLPQVNAAQAERFLDALDGFRVLPWIGGPNGGNVRLQNAKWRAMFTSQVRSLLVAHPRFASVENLTNALLGVHRGLSRQPLPANYQGLAVYCDWETSDSEWAHFRDHFLNQEVPVR